VIKKKSGTVLEETVRKAERAWFLSIMERKAKPGSKRDFHAGEIPRVFGTPSLIIELSLYNGKRNAYVRIKFFAIM
jgi:hypothetical protein